MLSRFDHDAIGAADAEIDSIDPGSEQVWEALRALYLVGQPDDLPAIRIYERNVPEIPDRLRQQALLTEKAIDNTTPYEVVMQGMGSDRLTISYHGYAHTHLDSLAHINLVSAIEQEFRIRFSLSELAGLKNVGDMIDLMEQKLAIK